MDAPRRDDAARLDAKDPLAAFVDRFHRPSGRPSLIYLDGNSLGPQPRAVAGVVHAEVDRWRDRLIRGWNERWLGLGDAAAAHIATVVDLVGVGVDLAVGCTYKYLHGGPGAPSWRYVSGDVADRLRSPIPGWFGHADPFAMEPTYRPAAGVARFRTGTPPVLSTAAMLPGLEVVAEAGVPAIRAKSVALTSLAIALADVWLAPLGVTLESPRDPAHRGGHIALRCRDAPRVSAMLVERHRVIGDARGTDILRLGMSPLGLRFVDVHDGVRRIADAIARRDVDRHTTDPRPGALTAPDAVVTCVVSCGGRRPPPPRRARLRRPPAGSARRRRWSCAAAPAHLGTPAA